MKPSKTALIVVSAGIFIIILASLGIVCFQRVKEQNQLSEQLALAQSRVSGAQLEQLSSRQTELEKQLSQDTSQFEAVKAILSQPESSVTVYSILFEIAEACRVEVVKMTSPGLANGDLEGISCSVLALGITVEGSISSLVNFVTKLNDYLTTGVVKSVTMTVPDTTNGESASAHIEAIVYIYRGD